MTEDSAVASMTGFARAHGGDERVSWTWELKCVNGRGLDLRCRLPQGWELLEPAARERIGRHLARGNLQVGLTVKTLEAAVKLRVNHEVLAQLGAVIEELRGRVEASPPSLDGLLNLRGVLETVEEEESEETRAARESAVLADLETALDALVAARRDEGRRLAEVVGGQLERITEILETARGLEAARPEALRRRLETQLAELLATSPPVSEERLAQELAVLVGKADVREEMDRLAAHVQAARELLDGGGAIGRRLDFLCQELNREANTLCAKSGDVALTRAGLDLKSVIEQLREQVQNIE